MSGCCGNKKNNGPISPDLKCPPDLSTLMLRFIDRKSLGVVKGNQDLFSFDLSNFFLPISNYSKQTICLNKGDIKLLDTGLGKDMGERRKIISFDLPNINYYNEYKISFFDEFGNLIGSELSGEFSNLSELETSLLEEISFDEEIKNKIELYKIENDTIYFRGKKPGKTFSVDFLIHDEYYYDIIELIGNTIQAPIRYPNGAYKFVFLFIEFCQDCNVPSNEQKIYWTQDDNLDWKPVGPILFLTGAEDLEEEDMNKIQSFWIKNEGNCEVKINVITGI